MESKNETYVISLDAVDLNWLPISQKHRDGGAVPLWSKSNLDSRRNEYYEFVIKSDDKKEDYSMESKNETYVISLDAVDLNWLPISQKHRDGGAVPLWSKSNLDSRRNEYYEFVIKSDDKKEDYRKDSKNEAYVIPLDAVDLNLLPISQKHRDGEAVPLWSKSNWDSRRNEYYEFVIKSDDTKEDQNEPVIENVTCHICDINVPKGYFKEHKNGFRHKFNRKVADIALKRLNLYVNKEDINEFNEKLPSKYFCTECSIVIDVEDETSHKQTTGHRNSLFLERFLNEFLNFYTNDDSGIGDTRKDIKTEVMKESANFKQDFVSDKQNITETLLANLKIESVKTKYVKETKGAENYKTILNSDKLNNNVRPSSDLQDEDAFLDVFDGSNTNKFKVTEMCYDAIVVTSATSEYCMICNEMFVRENRLLHVDSTLHCQNLRQKSLDKNCVRKINSSHHHCVLCNDYFAAYDLHVNSEEHLTNFRSKIIYRCKKTVQDNDKCSKDKEDDNSRKYIDVLKSDENKSSTSTNKNTLPVNKETRNSLVPSTSSNIAKNKKVENSDKTVKLDPKFYVCKVCQVKVLNSEKHIGIHNKGRPHKQKLQETETDKQEAGNKSKIEAKSKLNYQMKKTATLNIVTCIVCNVNLSYNDRHILTHIEGNSHKSNYNEFCKRNLLVLRSETLYCTACGVVPGLRNEFAHCNGRNHKTNLEEVVSV